jgi:hypothetical protein
VTCVGREEQRIKSQADLFLCKQRSRVKPCLTRSFCRADFARRKAEPWKKQPIRVWSTLVNLQKNPAQLAHPRKPARQQLPVKHSFSTASLWLPTASLLTQQICCDLCRCSSLPHKSHIIRFPFLFLTTSNVCPS